MNLYAKSLSECWRFPIGASILREFERFSGQLTRRASIIFSMGKKNRSSLCLATTLVFVRTETSQQSHDTTASMGKRSLQCLFPAEGDTWLAVLRIGLDIQVITYALFLRNDWNDIFAGTGSGLVSRELPSLSVPTAANRENSDRGVETTSSRTFRSS
jgi:hypothetical protein